MILSIDIETYSSVDLTKSGVYAYAEAPDFTILLFAYRFEGERTKIIDLANEERLPDRVLDALRDESVIKRAFNAQFERVCISKYIGERLSPITWECTSVKSAMCGLPHDLNRVASILKLPLQKDGSGKELIKYFSVPCKPTKTNGQRERNLPKHRPDAWEQFKSYCIQDVDVECLVADALTKFVMPIIEQKLYVLDQEINDRGMMIDKEFVESCVYVDEVVKDRFMQELKELTGLDNPNSVAQLKSFFAGHGVVVDSLNKSKILELIEEGVLTENLLRVVKLRQLLGKTSTAKYAAMLNSVCDSDRIKGLLQFYGASRTGRWCLAEGSKVLVKNKCGEILEKPIELVLIDDLVFDGLEWVKHEGVVFSGEKDIIEWDGVMATKEHIVFISEGVKMSLGEARAKGLELWRGNLKYMK